jgi:hypothetical protein
MRFKLEYFSMGSTLPAPTVVGTDHPTNDASAPGAIQANRKISADDDIDQAPLEIYRLYCRFSVD